MVTPKHPTGDPKANLLLTSEKAVFANLQFCWCGQRKLDSENSYTFESNSWIIHHQCLLSANPVFAKLEERAMNTLHSLHTLHTLRALLCKNFQIRTQQPHHQEHH